MNELIKTITRDDGTIAVSGRELHDFFWELAKTSPTGSKIWPRMGLKKVKTFRRFRRKPQMAGVHALNMS